MAAPIYYPGAVFTVALGIPPETVHQGKCMDCKFKHFDGSYGQHGRHQCRRFPPNPEWPVISVNDWCGEFK